MLPNPSHIQWTSYTSASAIQDVCIDHGRIEIFVTEQLLHGPDFDPMDIGLYEGYSGECE
jgi:hypothetical protein